MKKSFSKSKTLDNILKMLDRQIEENGNTLSIPMIRVDQKDGLYLYTCTLQTCFLQGMVCRLPRSLENPDGIQRALVMKKVAEIQKHLEEGNGSNGCYGIPNSIVITLKHSNNPFINLSPLENSSGVVVLTVDLYNYREHLSACETDADGYLIAPETELLGYMIDGHHRTEGAYEADRLDYPFPVSVYLDLGMRKLAASFAEINCNQEKPSAIHTNAVYNMAGLMTDEENTAFEMMEVLNKQPGVFCNHIKMFDGPRQRSLPRAFVNSSKLQKLLEKWLRVNLQNGFNYSTFAEKIDAVETYFNAWRSCYPEAWDSSTHVLTKTMGIDILFDLYDILCDFLRSVVLTRGARPTEDDFIKAIHLCFFKVEDRNGFAVHTPKRIILNDESGESIPLTWESPTFGGLSSGKGIHFLKGRLRDLVGSTRNECLQV